MKILINKIIKLKIIKCDNDDFWFSNKVGKTLYFWKKPFTDDQGILSLWVCERQPNKVGGRYVYLKNTNYNSYIRKKKLEKIKKSSI